MRNLIIKRNKSFVGCLGKLKVYLEDPMSNDLTINGVSCRKLGTLKNGEEAVFKIDSNSAKVFVIADKLSKGFCNEFFTIPAGENDFFLTGQCRYNPATGNAFRFDNVVDEEVLKNRKKGSKIGIVVLIIAVIVGFAIGFLKNSSIFDSTPDPKDFTVEEMQITLTDEFMNIPVGDFDACFGTEDVAILVLREDFELMEGLSDYTLEEYGQLILQAYELEGIAELQTIEGITYFEYEADTDENETYYYFSTIYKSNDAFWTIQFAVLTEEAETYIPYFIEWAKTITFTE